MVIPKPLPKYFFPLLIIIILAGMLFFWQKGISNKPKTTPAADLAKPTATAEINRTFEFKIKDPKNQSMTLKYTLLSAKKYCARCNYKFKNNSEKSYIGIGDYKYIVCQNCEFDYKNYTPKVKSVKDMKEFFMLKNKLI